MSKEVHTPGPWFDWKRREWIHEPQDLLANYKDACLIAAAPDLLAALKEVLNSDMAAREEDEGRKSKTLKIVRAALAKAEAK